MMSTKNDLYETAQLVKTGEFVKLDDHKDDYFLVNGEWVHKDDLKSFTL